MDVQIRRWKMTVKKKVDGHLTDFFKTLAMSSNLMMGSKIRKNYLLSQFGRIEIEKITKL